jgi:hypothetical protein
MIAAKFSLIANQKKEEQIIFVIEKLKHDLLSKKVLSSNTKKI